LKKRARANVLGFGALMCLCFPVAGYVSAIGPLFLGGGLFAPLVGVVLALVGILAEPRAAVLCSIALAINLSVWIFFAWLIFVHGLC
jgi:hypothetical protein